MSQNNKNLYCIAISDACRNMSRHFNFQIKLIIFHSSLILLHVVLVSTIGASLEHVCPYKGFDYRCVHVYNSESAVIKVL